MLVTRVDPDSDAADKGLQPGDVVLSVGNKPVHSPQDVQALIAAAQSERPQDACCCWSRRQGGTRFVAVDIGQA